MAADHAATNVKAGACYHKVVTLNIASHSMTTPSLSSDPIIRAMLYPNDNMMATQMIRMATKLSENPERLDAIINSDIDLSTVHPQILNEIWMSLPRFNKTHLAAPFLAKMTDRLDSQLEDILTVQSMAYPGMLQSWIQFILNKPRTVKRKIDVITNHSIHAFHEWLYNTETVSNEAESLVAPFIQAIEQLAGKQRDIVLLQPFFQPDFSLTGLESDWPPPNQEKLSALFDRIIHHLGNAIHTPFEASNYNTTNFHDNKKKIIQHPNLLHYLLYFKQQEADRLQIDIAPLLQSSMAIKALLAEGADWKKAIKDRQHITQATREAVRDLPFIRKIRLERVAKTAIKNNSQDTQDTISRTMLKI